jgi:hypothetical protein
MEENPEYLRHFCADRNPICQQRSNRIGFPPARERQSFIFEIGLARFM